MILLSKNSLDVLNNNLTPSSYLGHPSPAGEGKG
jgi:hypothetical protein